MAPAAEDRIPEMRRQDHFTNAFIHTVPQNAAEDGGPTVAVKDLIDVEGMPTSCGGPPAGATVAARDATAIASARRTGVFIVGKTNLYEWGYGVSSENRWHGAVLNPLAPERSAGGSSGGSAAAVAAGLCDWAVGTDTAGSVRIPAALCGVVGFKPSYDLIPREGVQPLSPSQDTLGVLAPSVAAASTGAWALAGTGGEHSDRGPARIAVPAGWVEELDADVDRAWRAIAAGLPEVDVGPRAPLFEHAARVQAFEAARVHDRALREDPGRFGPDVRARLQSGALISEAATEESVGALRQASARVEAGFDSCEVLALPTTACVAPPLGGAAEATREALTRFTRPFNATGQPAISLPLPVAGLPVGLQLIGRRGDDARLLAIAARVERALAAGEPLAGA